MIELTVSLAESKDTARENCFEKNRMLTPYSRHPGHGVHGARSKSIADVNKVGSDLITTRRVIFTPNVDIKDELKRTNINITCYDRNGELVKRVTSSDDGTVEDNENDNENQGGSQSGNQGGNPSGSDPSTGGSGQDNTGGGNEGDEPFDDGN